MRDDRTIRTDDSKFKRVELHAHSKMSELDAFSNPEDIIKLAASFGHKACAITDHGCVQGFPRFYEAANIINRNKNEEDKIKPIFGCEGYLVDDGPTIFYNLPYTSNNTNTEKEHTPVCVVGEFVSIAITANGDDPCAETFTHIAASKYRLKGYTAERPQNEGETLEQAEEIISQDIDRRLWDSSELPIELQDEYLPCKHIEGGNSAGHILNVEDDLNTPVSTDGMLHIPQKIQYEHVADFYADVKDVIYPGHGEPSESYFLMGELLSFIGNAYITGEGIFKTLGFIRRAGFGVNIEDHNYYRYKFLMPAISIEDIREYAAPSSIKYLNNLLTGNELVAKARKDAAFVISYLVDQNCVDPQALNSRIGHKDTAYLCSRNSKIYHITWYARNSLGLYNLYNLVSESNIHYFFRRPRTPKSLLKYFSSGLIIGGACERGEIYRMVMTAYKSSGKDAVKTIEYLKNDRVFKEALQLYDFVEIQPLCNNNFMIKKDSSYSDTGNVKLDETDIRNVNILIADLTYIFDKLLVATSDSHYLNAEDKIFRRYMLMAMGFIESEIDEGLYFRTTKEMLEEFSYLGYERAFEIVVTNPNAIADKIESGIKPFPFGNFYPDFQYAAKAIRDISYTKANKLYRYRGVLNRTVKERLDKELTTIIGNGYASLYYIPYRIAKYSKSKGFTIAVRGTAGSSLVAYLLGITGVNPLLPHYRCPKCNYTKFETSCAFGSGFDLPEEKCPDCDVVMCSDGHEIPFESFVSYHCDWMPRFEINVAATNRDSMCKFLEYLFGSHHTFKAGTIVTFGAKSSENIVKTVCQEQDIPYTTGSVQRISEGIIGVKKLTSQHPTGFIIVPNEMDINEFTPVQYPANDPDRGITTHFDLHSMHDTLLQQDILGNSVHDLLYRLQKLTGINIENVPVTDSKVMRLFDSSNDGLSTIGLPELHSPFVRKMIKETTPKTFFDVVQLLGLAHGTNTWNENAEELISGNICKLSDVLACRETIMTRLINYGIEPYDAYRIMTMVRKGKIARGRELNTWEHFKDIMTAHNVPDWFIESCQKIQYMFPKAHVVAYSISALKVAWFKVYYPIEYYCSVFSERREYFNANYMCKGLENLVNRKNMLSDHISDDENDFEFEGERFDHKEELRMCEVVEEMYKRGISFAPIDINQSHATDFIKIETNRILPPLSAIDGITDQMARIITCSRDEKPIKNRRDLLNTIRIGYATLEKMEKYGLLDSIPEDYQMNIFDMIDSVNDEGTDD